MKNFAKIRAIYRQAQLYVEDFRATQLDRLKYTDPIVFDRKLKHLELICRKELLHMNGLNPNPFYRLYRKFRGIIHT
jgi:hypothetical protein